MKVAVAAPGKVMLCGEYAVLFGAPAVVAAVDRYAIASWDAQEEAGPEASSPFVRRAWQLACNVLRAQDRPIPTRPPRVDSQALHDASGQKLGLGSSAAATVAALGATLEGGGLSLTDGAIRQVMLELGHACHRSTQGQGSGVDIASSVVGGILGFQRPSEDAQPHIEPLALPISLELTFVWTGVVARTGPLLAQVLARTSTGSWGRLTAAAERFAEAFATGDAPRVVTAAQEYGDAMATLGHATGCDLVTPSHARLAAAAARYGGAAKPSGAGGGDLSVAFFTDAKSASSFRDQILGDGFPMLDLRISSQGATRLADGGDASDNAPRSAPLADWPQTLTADP